ncbi:MAG: Methyltransferase type 12 [Candidatus Saccharibacteria bacterium]|nr:Methyltransferase type 12 [Candidatus Saccharibacteria bacterium]
MRAINKNSFNGAAAIFAEHAKTVRGFVRYEVSQQNLLPFLKRKHLRVLDVGGGSGLDAAWIADLGHQITVVEPSPKQFNYAERRFNFFLDDKQRSRLTLIHGTLEDLPPETEFDLVMMHGVAMYQEDPAAFIATVVPYIAPGGMLSLLEKGYYGAEARFLSHQSFDKYASLRNTGRYMSRFKLSVYAFKPEELEAIVKQAGLKTVQWTGVRVISDTNDELIDNIPQEELELIVDAEMRQGAEPTIRGQGQMLHFIARRPK